jgi:antitoxin HicB
MMQYSCKLEPNGAGGFVATFPDVPEALTEGATREEALANAADALEVALLGRMKDGDDVPRAAKTRGGTTIYVPAQSAAKLALYVAFRASGLSQSALGRKIGKDEAEIRRMLDPYHATKLPPLEEALLALGKRLVIDIKAA